MNEVNVNTGPISVQCASGYGVGAGGALDATGMAAAGVGAAGVGVAGVCWGVVLAHVAHNVCSFVLKDWGATFYRLRYGVSERTAGVLLSVPYAAVGSQARAPPVAAPPARLWCLVHTDWARAASAKASRETWGSGCDRFTAFSDAAGGQRQQATVLLPDLGEKYEALWGKVLRIWRWVGERAGVAFAESAFSSSMSGPRAGQDVTPPGGGNPPSPSSWGSEEEPRGEEALGRTPSE